MAKRFNFNKPIVESPVAPTNKNVIWVDVEESTGKVLTLKEFINNEWTTILTSGVPAYSAAYKAFLTDALSVSDLTSLVTDLAEAIGYTLTEATTEEETTPGE